MTDSENNSFEEEEESFLENDDTDNDHDDDEIKKFRGASKTYIKQENFEKCEEMIAKLHSEQYLGEKWLSKGKKETETGDKYWYFCQYKKVNCY